MAQVDSENSTATPADPIYAAIEAHRAAYAAYDQAAEAPDDENEEAFRELDRASQLLMRAEASTLAGLIALLRYVAPLLQEAGAPGFPIEIPFAGRWSAAFGSFCANVAKSLVAIVTAGSAATPERIDRIANAIVEATAPLIDDFEVARRAARVAIEAIASYTRCLVTASTQELEGGARCVSSARRDLYGGRLATAVPTVTIAMHRPRREVSPRRWSCGAGRGRDHA
jgi:hypothetical protein